MRASLALASFLFLAGMTYPAFAASNIITLEACPLDTLTFVDPWAGGTFAVDKVGRHYSYLCGDEVSAVKKDGQACRGPYGELVLRGKLRKSGEEPEETVFAVWNTIVGSPCCWWDIFDKEKDAIGASFAWFSAGEVPTLGSMPFLSIEPNHLSNDRAEKIFGNPKTALKCFVR